MATTKRYKDGDRLHANVFNALLDSVDKLESDVEIIKKSIPKKTSQLINDSGFITEDNNTWRNVKVNNREILSSNVDGKPLNLVQGKGITITGDSNGNVTLSSQGESYVAGENIEINGNVISAVDTKYTASDFDIKDLADSTGLRDKWDNLIDDSAITENSTFSSSKIVELIEDIVSFDVEVVYELPEIGKPNTLYFVPEAKWNFGDNLHIIFSDKSLDEMNSMSEYMWINNKWELIGSTQIDLSNYYTVSETNALLDEKQSLLIAGDGISIDATNTISVVGKQDEVNITAQEVLDFLNDESELL